MVRQNLKSDYLRQGKILTTSRQYGDPANIHVSSAPIKNLKSTIMSCLYFCVDQNDAGLLVRHILQMSWLQNSPNQKLLTRCLHAFIDTNMTRRRWSDLSYHTERKVDISKTALQWTKEGKQTRGRPIMK